MKDIILKTSVTVAEGISTLHTKLVDFSKKQDGVTAIEYAVIAVAISGLLMAVFGSGKDSFLEVIKGKFSTLTTNIKGTN